MGTPRRGYALLGAFVALMSCQLASAAPVGLLESLDLEVIQGGNTVFQFTGVQVNGLLNGQDIALGSVGTTDVFLRVQADQSGTGLVEDRWHQFTIRGLDSTGAAANLLDSEADGTIEVRVTNMKFDNVDGVNGNRVAPFSPNEYAPYPLTDLPFFYLLDEYNGFVNLPGSERYSPSEPYPYDLGGWARPSVQVPMYVWANPAWGYGFQQVDNGYLTGFAMSGVADFGGTGASHTGALELTPVLDPPVPPYFGTNAVPDVSECGFVSEIGFNLNMRGYVVPEPATAILLLLPLMVRRSRRVR